MATCCARRLSDQRSHQFDFEGHSCLECGQQPSSLLRIVQHQRTASTIGPSDSAMANDREYGSTAPFSMRCTPVIPPTNATLPLSPAARKNSGIDAFAQQAHGGL